jgi:poly-gamma-glutamate synthesis protein (capsule biosynthesis protein)
MKKLLFLLCVIIAPLIFFSFLASTDMVGRSDVTLFIDARMNTEHRLMIAGKLTGVLDELGYRITVESFDREKLNSYLLTSPDALYITQHTMSSDLFVLQYIDCIDVRVPVSLRHSRLNSVPASSLKDLVAREGFVDRDVLRKVLRNRIDVGAISFENLSLNVKPLSVDGVVPTLKAVKNGSYPWKFDAHVYGREGNALLTDDEVRESISPNMDNMFTLVAGGDIMLSRGTSRYIDQYGPRYPFLEIRDIIHDHDIAFANLESPISSRGRRFYPNKGIYFRADPSVIDGLLYSGFDVFSLGNNHSLDWGVAALQDTIAILEQNGFSFSGAGVSWQDAFYPAVMEVHGTTVAIISINDIYPFEVSDGGRNTMLTLTYDAEALQREIRNMEKKYDIIIASVHAGIEYIDKPEPVKVDMMRKLIDYGIDVIIGHHPHVIQGIEVYGEGLIAYSLGNLIFDQKWSRETSLGLLLEICFFKDRPLYYLPRVILIDDSQARILVNEESQSIISTLSMENSGYEYVKN